MVNDMTFVVTAAWRERAADGADASRQQDGRDNVGGQRMRVRCAGVVSVGVVVLVVWAGRCVRAQHDDDVGAVRLDLGKRKQANRRVKGTKQNRLQAAGKRMSPLPPRQRRFFYYLYLPPPGAAPTISRGGVGDALRRLQCQPRLPQTTTLPHACNHRPPGLGVTTRHCCRPTAATRKQYPIPFCFWRVPPLRLFDPMFWRRRRGVVDSFVTFRRGCMPFVRWTGFVVRSAGGIPHNVSRSMNMNNAFCAGFEHFVWRKVTERHTHISS